MEGRSLIVEMSSFTSILNLLSAHAPHALEASVFLNAADLCSDLVPIVPISSHSLSLSPCMEMAS